MNDTIQVKKVKCPHCGWIRRMEIRTESGQVTVVMGGVTDWLKNLNQKLQDLSKDPELAAANAWIDLHECPHCERAYEYNLITGATR